jgi:cell division protein FtsB
MDGASHRRIARKEAHLIYVASGRREAAARNETRVSTRAGIALAVISLLVLFCFESYRAYAFYADVHSARASLLSLRDELDLNSLQDSEADILASRAKLEDAQARTASAAKFVHTDPFLKLATHLPIVGEQARGLTTLVEASQLAAETGLDATDVALAFARQPDDPDTSAIQQALVFLEDQKQPMAKVQSGLERLQAKQASLPSGLIGPLGSAATQLGDSLNKLDGLVTGFNRAEALLPGLLGYQGSRSYLVLPQNDTELFPSGGLISSYGIATFHDGQMDGIKFEYFEALYNRWQAATHEYVNPPAPLKQYLLHNYSWGLGEAGWYPDFPTTASLASSFVQKGGAPATDGVIAIDLQFISALLGQFGSVYVPAYDVTVDPTNVSELTLELTRDDYNTPAAQQKAFLSDLSQALLKRIFATPKDEWVGLLSVLDRMAQERHLQIHFNDASLQALAVEYGLDGSIEKPAGDYLMVADTSVNSTKLNMILQPSLDVAVQLQPDGSAATHVAYSLANPFPDWAKGRDADLVERLMFSGVYGSFLRVYAPPQASLRYVTNDGNPVGAEQISTDFGYKAFGRYFQVLPGKSSKLEVAYQTPDIVQTSGTEHTYRLYVQKEAGTDAVPLSLTLSLPPGAHLDSVTLDGKRNLTGLTINTDLRTDRTIEVTYQTP